jgi:hypothetical protein
MISWMTVADDEFLQHQALSAHEWRGVTELANALSEFEPLAKRGHLGKKVADQLVSIGLAESGPASERYRAIGFDVGYRLSPRGRKVLERGRYPKKR